MHNFAARLMCACMRARVLQLTGSLVRAGLLTLRPKASSWNCSSWTTRPASDLLEGESFWTCWTHTHTHTPSFSHMAFQRAGRDTQVGCRRKGLDGPATITEQPSAKKTCMPLPTHCHGSVIWIIIIFDNWKGDNIRLALKQLSHFLTETSLKDIAYFMYTIIYFQQYMVGQNLYYNFHHYYYFPSCTEQVWQKKCPTYGVRLSDRFVPS